MPNGPPPHLHHQSTNPVIAIVICTDGRADALAKTLHCLEFLDGPEFEVCVVQGPTEDGTSEILENWTGRIKHARVMERNLSASRNIGIALTRADIVAFIDDDSLPEPEWLCQLAPAFADPAVGAAGGIVLDPHGTKPQFLYPRADRRGNASWDYPEPASDYNFPLSETFPFVQGANSAFRRTALLAVGGFDEEFEYYLDETDVCCRMIDAGWTIHQLSNAFVHHKSLKSSIRNEEGVTHSRYCLLKNKLYFSIVNNKFHHTMSKIIDDMIEFINNQETDILYHISIGLLDATKLNEFQTDVEQAWTDGLRQGLSGKRRLRTDAALTPVSNSYLPFSRPQPEGGRNVFVFVSHDYPPKGIGGVSRYIHQTARAVARLGHHVHVVTRGDDHDRIEFEDGIWVHRIMPSNELFPFSLAIPPYIHAWTSAVLQCLRGINRRRVVTAVYAPLWNCDAAMIVEDKLFAVVIGLQTPLYFWLESHAHLADESFTIPMLKLEAKLLRECDAVHAISHAIARDIEKAYGVPLPPSRCHMLPLGLDDDTGEENIEPDLLPAGSLRLLFVGRLEARKGIDVLLDVLPSLFRKYPYLYADVVGTDTIPGVDGNPYRIAWQTSIEPDLVHRLRFYGEVTDPQLRGFYRSCDIVVAPSRFESFGLVLVEAMMNGKPVVTCRTGGTVEVAEENVTALFAEPGDPVSLKTHLETMLSDPALRRDMGLKGRERYKSRFSTQRVAEGIVQILRQTADRHTSIADFGAGFGTTAK
jgi:glycosyltransferase involved in cell wall biosynthesis/GT2 family glycosyltransferase